MSVQSGDEGKDLQHCYNSSQRSSDGSDSQSLHHQHPLPLHHFLNVTASAATSRGDVSLLSAQGYQRFSSSVGGTTRAGGAGSALLSGSSTDSSTQQQPPPPVIKCDLCGTAFTGRLGKYSLQRHMKAVHYKLEMFNCSVCGAPFNRKDSLDRHIMSKHRPVVEFGATPSSDGASIQPNNSSKSVRDSAATHLADNHNSSNLSWSLEQFSARQYKKEGAL